MRPAFQQCKSIPATVLPTCIALVNNFGNNERHIVWLKFGPCILLWEMFKLGRDKRKFKVGDNDLTCLQQFIDNEIDDIFRGLLGIVIQCVEVR